MWKAVTNVPEVPIASTFTLELIVCNNPECHNMKWKKVLNE